MVLSMGLCRCDIALQFPATSGDQLELINSQVHEPKQLLSWPPVECDEPQVVCEHASTRADDCLAFSLYADLQKRPNASLRDELSDHGRWILNQVS
jgi:hypothetical protein